MSPWAASSAEGPPARRAGASRDPLRAPPPLAAPRAARAPAAPWARTASIPASEHRGRRTTACPRRGSAASSEPRRWSACCAATTGEGWTTGATSWDRGAPSAASAATLQRTSPPATGTATWGLRPPAWSARHPQQRRRRRSTRASALPPPTAAWLPSRTPAAAADQGWTTPPACSTMARTPGPGALGTRAWTTPACGSPSLARPLCRPRQEASPLPTAAAGWCTTRRSARPAWAAWTTACTARSAESWLPPAAQGTTPRRTPR
mmetsp:Transcript_24530/g.92668  ORF Transcript_24530/g.92668 Transcript_24530/m.92668 type:complete len:264 (+) Transcript_24530:1175-1966(+)